MSAAFYKLDNLTVIVDRNGLQITGRTEDVMALESLRDKFAAFGYAVRVCDGNDITDLTRTLESVPFEPGKPSLIIAQTVKGKGVSFIENAIPWHHHVPTDDELARALAELDQRRTRFRIRGSLMEPGRANLDEFAATLIELARADRDLLVLTSDSRGSGKLGAFAKELPDQIVEVGIAEQNLVGIAAGLAAAGKQVFAVSPACFLTARALEQIKNDVAYSDHPVKLIGISAGVSYGPLGTTHHSLHDYAALRAINNIDVVAPADNFETRAAIRAAAVHPRPIYLRFGKKAMPHLHAPDTTFEIGKAITITTGSDITFIATGETVAPAVERVRSPGRARPLVRRDQYAHDQAARCRGADPGGAHAQGADHRRGAFRIRRIGRSLRRRVDAARDRPAV